MAKRPEHENPPDLYYDDDHAKKYANNTRMIEIQTQMSERAIELLRLPEGRSCYILDIGCGSGLSGEALTDAGHRWVGIDIAPSMLGVAVAREVEGDLVCQDMGQGLMFRPGVFDGAISISALQWLCNADHRDHVPQKRLKKFFCDLYACLGRGARAVFQFYPETPQQMELITEQAMRAGFSGGLVIDYPNSTKAKKIFLCLFAGETAAYELPKAKTESDLLDDAGDGDEKTEPRETVLFSKQQNSHSKQKRERKQKRAPVKSREWIQKKKRQNESQGKGCCRRFEIHWEKTCWKVLLIRCLKMQHTKFVQPKSRIPLDSDGPGIRL